jgi:hypothetical protein
MILTIEIAQTELKRLADLEMQLRELSVIITETDSFKKFTPQPGNLLQVINLLGNVGAVYAVSNNAKRDSGQADPL